jgi:hypothetical protein
MSNGALLARIGGAFDAFVTVDKNLPAQKELSGLAFGVIVLRASSNRLEALKAMVPELLVALETLQPGMLVSIAPNSGSG